MELLGMWRNKFPRRGPFGESFKFKVKGSKFLVLSSWFLALASCNDHASPSTPEQSAISNHKSAVAAPDFNADSAFVFVKTQVDFGPRVPGTKAHAACADWIVKKFKSYGWETQIQRGKVTTVDNHVFDLKNIIASYKPELGNRILICAHWDARPWADSDTINTDKPIDAADDAASGVAVALEMARQINTKQVGVGIDIVLFDVEDYGKNNVEESWCLGSQFWGKNLHKPGYTASYGILLDMVGAKGATFLKEQTSMYYAPSIVKKVWDAAAKAGYSDYFIYEDGGGTTDDHYYVNTLAKIPTIDIINMDRTTGRFGSYHHTHRDNMNIIDKNTLKAVGQTLLQVLYSDAPTI